MKAKEQAFDFTSGGLKTKLGKRTKKNKKSEERVQLLICKYLRSQYPNVIFSCDVAAGMRLMPWIAKKVKDMKSGRGYPDLTIDKRNGKFGGLKLELKNVIGDVYLVDGITLKSNPHVHEQAKVLEQLRAEGYYADFAFGFDGVKKIIDWYMGNM